MAFSGNGLLRYDPGSLKQNSGNDGSGVGRYDARYALYLAQYAPLVCTACADVLCPAVADGAGGSGNRGAALHRALCLPEAVLRLIRALGRVCAVARRLQYA